MSNPVPVPTEPSAAHWRDGLSDKEQRFVEEYLIDLRAGEAALRCGYGRGNKKSAIEVGSRLKRKLAASISAALAESSGVTATAVVGELGAIAFSRIDRYLKIQDGRLVLAVASLSDLSEEALAAIAKLKERIDPNTGTVTIEVELHDKIPALNQLGRAVGLKNQIEVDHHHEVEVIDPLDRIKERLNALHRARAGAPVVEIEPPLRISAPRPEPAAPTIDAQVD
jgi:phage terminase small subunit